MSQTFNIQTHSDTLSSLSQLKDTALMTQFSVMVQKERGAIANIIRHLAEIGKRRLYLKERSKIF